MIELRGMKCGQCHDDLLVGVIKPKPLPHVMLMPMWGEPRESEAPRLCSIACVEDWLKANWPLPDAAPTSTSTDGGS